MPVFAKKALPIGKLACQNVILLNSVYVREDLT